jgi:hypothetical protein
MNIGKYNYWVTRLLHQGSRFIQLANFGMLVYLTSKENQLAWVVVPLGIVLTGLWFFIDNKKVLEEELEYQYLRIPVIREMRDDIKEIKEAMK